MQRARERHSRHFDLTSDMKILDVMLGSFPKNDSESEPEDEQDVDSASVGLHKKTETLREDFRCILNSNSRGNSVSTVETVRLLNEELNTQMSRKLKEIKMGSNSQILSVINTALVEQVITGPSVNRTGLEHRRY